MSTRKPRDAELDGDLVDPSFGASATPDPGPVGHPSQTNPQVLVGGGEREARAYVGPTALPAGAAPKPADAAGGKVAIASSVDPRRMPTVRLAPGRPRPPLAPGERPVPPEAMTPFPGTSRPAPPPSFDAMPRSQPVPSQPRSMAPPSSAEPASTPMIVWILAVVLAGLVGAGAALWIRRNMGAKPEAAPPATAPAQAPAPARS